MNTRLKHLRKGKLYGFEAIQMDDISLDTARKHIHRLAERGEVKIVKRGKFIRTEPLKTKLFIYGSLKRGFDNHKLLTRSALCRGKATTRAKFVLYEERFGNYPIMTRKPFAHIEGELYEIRTQELLDDLDRFEGVPEYYDRISIQVIYQGRIVNAETYLVKDYQADADQKPLSRWENDTDAKMARFRNLIGLDH